MISIRSELVRKEFQGDFLCLPTKRGDEYSGRAQLSLQLPIKVTEEINNSFRHNPYLKLAHVHNFAAKGYHIAQRVENLDAFQNNCFLFERPF
jgi:hypothetical protein